MISAGAEFDPSMTPAEMRAAAAARPVSNPPDVASVQVIDAEGVTCRLYHPLDGEDAPPLVVYFHGGGWVLQFTDGHATTARHLANKSGCAVMAVDYRLAPEHPFPAAYDDSWAATVWAFDNLEALGCRRGPIGLTGDSAGGNLAAAVALRAIDSDVEVASVALVYPSVDHRPKDYDSYRRYADAPILNSALMARFGALYKGEADPADWRLSPLSAPDVGGLPPTMVVAAEIDPLFSEGLAWSERLQASDVDATHHTIPGTFHAFFGFVDELEESRQAQALIAGHLARLSA